MKTWGLCIAAVLVAFTARPALAAEDGADEPLGADPASKAGPLKPGFHLRLGTAFALFGASGPVESLDDTVVWGRASGFGAGALLDVGAPVSSRVVLGLSIHSQIGATDLHRGDDRKSASVQLLSVGPVVGYYGNRGVVLSASPGWWIANRVAYDEALMGPGLFIGVDTEAKAWTGATIGVGVHAGVGALFNYHVDDGRPGIAYGFTIPALVRF